MNVLHTSWQLLKMSSIFENIRSSSASEMQFQASRSEFVILHISFNDIVAFLLFFFLFLRGTNLINSFSPLIGTLYFLCFISSILRHKKVSDHWFLRKSKSLWCLLTPLEVCPNNSGHPAYRLYYSFLDNFNRQLKLLTEILFKLLHQIKIYTSFKIYQTLKCI